VGLEQGAISVVRITEELLEWKSSGSRSRKPRVKAVGIRCADQSTRRKPAPASLCPPQIPLDQIRARTWAARVRSQRLTAIASIYFMFYLASRNGSWTCLVYLYIGLPILFTNDIETHGTNDEEGSQPKELLFNTSCWFVTNSLVTEPLVLTLTIQHADTGYVPQYSCRLEALLHAS
jgi:hypothetical protein